MLIYFLFNFPVPAMGFGLISSVVGNPILFVIKYVIIVPLIIIIKIILWPITVIIKMLLIPVKLLLVPLKLLTYPMSTLLEPFKIIHRIIMKTWNSITLRFM